MRRLLPLLLALVVPTAASLPRSVDAAVTIVSDLGDCEFLLDYGNTGGARQLGALYVDGVGTFSNFEIESQTDLDLDCFDQGDGSQVLRIEHLLTNTSQSPTPELRYFVFVDPDGSANAVSPSLLDVPAVSFAAAAPDGPDFYDIDAFENLDIFTPGNLDHDVFANGQLADRQGCGPYCDVVFALQWDIGVLEPGERAIITVHLSDTGQVISPRFLTAARADDAGSPDDPNTILTFSGVSVVTLPLPAPALSDSALVLLAGLLIATAIGIRWTCCGTHS